MMCGRMVQALPMDVVKEILNIRESHVGLEPNYNLAPTQMAAVVRLNPKTKTRSLDELKWWLTPADLDVTHRYATFNARAEELTHKKMFQGAWDAGRRCLIPINAYYEWKTEGKEKHPYAIGRNDGKLMTLAGLWEGKRLENGDVLRSFTVITTKAHGAMAELHDRIPVIIEDQNWASWLGEMSIDAAALFHSPSEDVLDVWPANDAVGNFRNNYPDLLRA